ncbi:MAG: glycoside hydrolase family 3 N-terminal domain-containing protein, partial [Candidatus Gastranaerophilaceae bacterium]
MNTTSTLKKLNLREKILQMFIIGFEGVDLDEKNVLFQNLLKEGVGGVIFFAQNLKNRDKFKNLTALINSCPKIPPFLSIDQEGGLVERTIQLDEKVDYLTPLALCQIENVDLTKQHTEIMAQDLLDLGINMNFAPLLDVNTNPYNPIIGVRAFSNNPVKVEKCAKVVYKTLSHNNIIPVGKHFPGHGEASVDSHIDMPQIDMKMDELETLHIKPFILAINEDIDALMIAHVHYRAFNEEKIPASLSKEVISDYLTDKLDFKGLIISDDMVMGGVAKHYGLEQSLIKGIQAGIDVFIFRDTTPELIDCIEKLVLKVSTGEISEERIDKSVKKILEKKKKYNLFKKSDIKQTFNIEKAQEMIDNIALKSVKIIKKGKLLPLDKKKKYLIISPDRSKIFNLSFDKRNLSCYFKDFQADEYFFSPNPQADEIDYIFKIAPNYDALIFVSYNAHINTKQIDICKNLVIPYIVISTG